MEEHVMGHGSLFPVNYISAPLFNSPPPERKMESGRIPHIFIGY
ncbi:MAG: hypothetical protein ACPL5I_06130 [Thermodesulfobacteriota bacterium]